MNIIIAQKLKEIMKTSSRDSGLVNPFITKNKIQHEDSTNSEIVIVRLIKMDLSLLNK